MSRDVPKTVHLRGAFHCLVADVYQSHVGICQSRAAVRVQRHSTALEVQHAVSC